MLKHTWGSHVPLNNAIIDTFNITGVVELGAGLYSTPNLFKIAPKVISIEQDSEWIKAVREEATESDNHKIIEVAPPSHIKRGTHRKEITNQVFEAFNKALNTYITGDYNMMFVDCYSGFRYEALIKHHSKFDIVTFHDYQRKGVIKHYAGGFVPNSNYQMFIDETYQNHTAFIIKRHLLDKYNDLFANHKKRVVQWLPAETKIIKL